MAAAAYPAGFVGQIVPKYRKSLQISCKWTGVTNLEVILATISNEVKKKCANMLQLCDRFLRSSELGPRFANGFILYQNSFTKSRHFLCQTSLLHQQNAFLFRPAAAESLPPCHNLLFICLFVIFNHRQSTYSTRQKYSAPSMQRRRHARVKNIDLNFCENVHCALAIAI